MVIIYAELREAGLEDEPGFKIEGGNIKYLHYADGATFVRQKCKESVISVEDHGEKNGSEIKYEYNHNRYNKLK